MNKPNLYENLSLLQWKLGNNMTKYNKYSWLDIIGSFVKFWNQIIWNIEQSMSKYLFHLL
jgi:hypothetical protein